jgi:acetyl esterase/lipase
MRRTLVPLTLSASLLVGAAALAATPPVQPKDGPGGVADAAAPIVKRAVGTASAATFVFYKGGPATGPRPVAIFLPAWGVMNPQSYGGWIDHLARKGFLVLFPRYQEVNRTRPADAPGNAVSLVKEALAQLAQDAEAKPDLDRVAVIGHLAGAGVAVDLAAAAKNEGLPVPKLVFAVTPGGIASDEKSRGVPLRDLSEIDPATLVIAMSGDRDFRAADAVSRRILREADKVPPERKLFMRLLSDDHGFPALSATLFAAGSALPAYDAAQIKVPPDPPRDPKDPRNPNRQKWSPDMALTGEQTVLVQQLAGATTDSVDYLGYWKTFDMAADAAFSGKDAQALRNDQRFTDMERWSDGWPVKRLVAEAPKPETKGVAPAKKIPMAPTKLPVPSKRRR